MLYKRRKSLISKDMKYYNWQKLLVPFTSWIDTFVYFFLSQTFNCHISKTVTDFDLIPTLRARPNYQLSSCSLVVEDYTQQNRWDYTQLTRDWAALESSKSNLWDLIVKKVVLSNQKTQVLCRSVATKLYKHARSPNLSLAPLREGRF